jgi:hypothetical protein
VEASENLSLTILQNVCQGTGAGTDAEIVVDCGKGWVDGRYLGCFG